MRIKSAFSSFIFVFSISFVVEASTLPLRIQKAILGRGEVYRLFVASGRSTIIQFPCNVMYVSVGPTKDFDAIVNDKDSRQVEVWLTKPDSEPSGLKVSCKDDFFVFDISPSKLVHQDLLIVSGESGSVPSVSSIDQAKAKLLASSQASNEKLKQGPTVKRLLFSSRGASK